MPSIASGTKLSIFVEVFRQSATEVFSKALSADWTVSLPDEGAEEPTASDQLAFKLSVSGSVQGDAAILIQKKDVLLLAQKLLKQDTAGAELSPEHQQAIEAIFQQILTAVQASLTSRFGEVKSHLSSCEVPNWQGTNVPFLLQQGTENIPLLLQFSKELTDVLAAPFEASAANHKRPSNEHSGQNLALLLGIDLSLTLQFGKSSLKLREIFDLPSGSVIEVDRQVQEPVELLLGERVIAKGEVIVMDGNYGLRITEVPAFVAD